jgi:hypothetical protein
MAPKPFFLKPAPKHALSPALLLPWARAPPSLFWTPRRSSSMAGAQASFPHGARLPVPWCPVVAPFFTWTRAPLLRLASLQAGPAAALHSTSHGAPATSMAASPPWELSSSPFMAPPALPCPARKRPGQERLELAPAPLSLPSAPCKSSPSSPCSSPCCSAGNAATALRSTPARAPFLAVRRGARQLFVKMRSKPRAAGSLFREALWTARRRCSPWVAVFAQPLCRRRSPLVRPRRFMFDSASGYFSYD